VNTYYRGQSVAITATFRDGSRDLTSPDDVSIAVRAPSGDVEPLYTEEAGDGRFLAEFDTSSAEEGVHVASATGTGGLVAFADVTFRVAALPEP
jgi:hypothetical protein